MGDAVPAVEVDVPAAADSLLADTPAPIPAAQVAASTDTQDSTPKAETPAVGDAGKSEPAEAGSDSLLAEDNDGKAKEDADGHADAKPEAAPEKYEAFTLPEGMGLDEEAMAKATPVLRELGLDQEKAQKLVSLYADMTKATVDGIQTQQQSAHKQLTTEWAAKVKAHPEFGGDKLPQSKAAAIAAINALSGSPQEASELRSMLSEWGIGNNPLLFALLVRAGSKLSEDTLVIADPAAQAHPKKPGDLLYAETTSKG